MVIPLFECEKCGKVFRNNPLVLVHEALKTTGDGLDGLVTKTANSGYITRYAIWRKSDSLTENHEYMYNVETIDVRPGKDGAMEEHDIDRNRLQKPIIGVIAFSIVKGQIKEGLYKLLHPKEFTEFKDFVENDDFLRQHYINVKLKNNY